jgi:hypothetical protein
MNILQSYVHILWNDIYENLVVKSIGSSVFSFLDFSSSDSWMQVRLGVQLFYLCTWRWIL